MKNWKRLFYYLMINVLVSACVVVAVLAIWDRVRQPEVATFESAAQSLRSSNPDSVVGDPSGIPGATANPETPSRVVEATPTEEPPPEPSGNNIEYAVQSGDTLGKIADQFDVTIEEIIAANDLTDPNRLDVGQVLIIPGQPGPEQSESQPQETEPPAASTGEPPEDSGNPVVIIDSVVGAGDMNSERVLLKRTGTGELSLAGWQLLEEEGEVFTFPRLILFEDGAVNVHTRSGQPTVVDLFWGLEASVWESGETVVLLDARGDVKATYRVP